MKKNPNKLMNKHTNIIPTWGHSSPNCHLQKQTINKAPTKEENIYFDKMNLAF